MDNPDYCVDLRVVSAYREQAHIEARKKGIEIVGGFRALPGIYDDVASLMAKVGFDITRKETDDGLVILVKVPEGAKVSKEQIGMYARRALVGTSLEPIVKDLHKDA